MLISVIVPTYNGAQKLGNILTALANQTFRDFELLIAVDGSTDATLEWLEGSRFEIPYRFFYQQNGGRAVIRNKAVKEAKGDLLIFFDDDMRPEPGCVAAHILHHQSRPGSILSGAQIDDYGKAATDFQKYKCALSRSWAEGLKKQEGQPLPFENLYITAGNFSISRELFHRVGGFNEQLRDCEDYDFALRAFRLEIPIYYSEAAFGWHDDFQTPASFIKRQVEYKKYNEILFRFYPDQYSHLLQTRLKQPGKLKSAFFSLFKSTAWVKAVEKSRLGFLPRKLRYRLYTWIITAHSTYKALL